MYQVALCSSMCKGIIFYFDNGPKYNSNRKGTFLKHHFSIIKGVLVPKVNDGSFILKVPIHS